MAPILWPSKGGRPTVGTVLVCTALACLGRAWLWGPAPPSTVKMPKQPFQFRRRVLPSPWHFATSYPESASGGTWLNAVGGAGPQRCRGGALSHVGG